MKILPIWFVLVCCVCCTFFIVTQAWAQDGNGLINEVNALRVANGLAPYTPDSSLSAYAQAQSDYQASIGKITHDRADGSLIPARSENVCGGRGITPSVCINRMWTDQLHQYTLIGLDSGSVGAGAAVGADGAIYYTLLVNSAGADTNLEKQANVPVAAAPATGQVGQNLNAGANVIDVMAAPVQPGNFPTSTAMPDGSIYHTVQANETLWTIAVNYNTTVAHLQALNGKAENDTSVIAGQKLLIIYGGTPVVDTLTPTVTRPPATNTPRATSTITATLPPLASLTPTITPVPTRGPMIQHIAFFDRPEARRFGLILTILCGLGLIATLYFGFSRK